MNSQKSIFLSTILMAATLCFSIIPSYGEDWRPNNGKIRIQYLNAVNTNEGKRITVRMTNTFLAADVYVRISSTNAIRNHNWSGTIYAQESINPAFSFRSVDHPVIRLEYRIKD
ncbi:MAG: hypothetical protein AAF558_00010 [Verrucomicrobiota bacterium]